MKKLALMLIILAVAGTASANLLSDSGMDGTLLTLGTGGFDPDGVNNGSVKNQWMDNGKWALGGGVATKTSVDSGNMVQIIDIPAAGTYTLSADVLAANGNTYIKVLASGGNNYPSFDSAPGDMGDMTVLGAGTGTIANAASQNYSFDFEVTEAMLTGATPKITLVVIVRQYFVGGAVVDNVQITPEPATMSLLAIGGVAALIRRKR